MDAVDEPAAAETPEELDALDRALEGLAQRESVTYNAQLAAHEACANIIDHAYAGAADQLALCKRFAYGKGDRFADTAYTLGQSGLPILDGALAWFECHNRSRYEEGDHVIFVGEVERCGFADGGQPLVYQNSQFSTTQTLP